MAIRAIDPLALESLLIEALNASDRLEYDLVGAHLATALDAFQREARRGRPPTATRRASAAEACANRA